MAIENAVRSYSISKDIFSKDLHEVIRSGKSNDRNLKWNIMNIFPNVQFQLHAHPNIEVIWVVRGAIHEYRLQVMSTVHISIMIIMMIIISKSYVVSDSSPEKRFPCQ